jgi:lipopolysaccharide/colanic/teichoic acid biosynthesis glycosyltransferase
MWTLISTFSIRLLLSSIKEEYFKFEIVREKKRIIIVGDKSESKRVFSILEQSNFKPELVGKVHPDAKEPNGGFIGNVSQIEEIVAINKVDEIIFCSKNISSQEIINIMLHFTNTDVDFKIAPPESLSIIGSNSINTAGELYVLNLNTISRSINQRRKRFLDALISVILILVSPVLVLIIKHPGMMIKNLIFVFTGRYTLIGYHGKMNEETDNLPFLKKGILSPVDALKNSRIESETIEKINLLYAKDYKVLNDLNILFKGFRNLGRKVI